MPDNNDPNQENIPPQNVNQPLNQAGSPTSAQQLHAQKEQRKQEEAKRKKENEELAKRKKVVEERAQQINALTQRAAPPQAGRTQSFSEKVQHLAGLSPEGLAGEALVNFLMLGVMLTLNPSYLEQRAQFYQALSSERNALLKAYLPDEQGNYPLLYELDDEGNVDKNKPMLDIDPATVEERIILGNGYYAKPVRLVYMPDSTGKWPTVYYTDPNTGQIDYNRTYNNAKGNAPDYAIYANGLIPEASITRGLENAITYYKQHSMGENWINAEEKLKLWGSLGAEAHRDNQDDVAADVTAQRAMMMKAAKR